MGLPIDRNAETKRVAFGVVFDADVGEVNVADPVVLVEIHQEVPVAEHQRAGHWVLPPQGYSPPKASSKSKTFSKSVSRSSSCLIRIPVSTRAKTMRPTSAVALTPQWSSTVLAMGPNRSSARS